MVYDRVSDGDKFRMRILILDGRVIYSHHKIEAKEFSS